MPIEALLDVLHLARRGGLVLASLESRMANLDDPTEPALFVVESPASA